MTNRIVIPNIFEIMWALFLLGCLTTASLTGGLVSIYCVQIWVLGSLHFSDIRNFKLSDMFPCYPILEWLSAKYVTAWSDPLFDVVIPNIQNV